MRLYIGNKNYSSWSLRPWLLMKHKGIAFEEVRWSFNDPDFQTKVSRVSPAGRVPVLVDGSFSVWDSLAISEYLADKFPEKGIWPEALEMRARARSLCAEIHAGFPHLRSEMTHVLDATLPGRGWNIRVQRDIDRIEAAFREALSASGGPFLFGEFGAVDAFYTPVAIRFRTYGVALQRDADAYVKRLLGTPAFLELDREARAERDYVPHDEPYRGNPYG